MHWAFQYNHNPVMSEKKINGYVIHTKQVLGKGTYGCVYRGQQDGTKKQVAVKILEKKLINKDEYLKSALLSEVKILQLLKSQNVVSVMDVMESNNNYYIIQQLCDSDFQKYIEKKKKIPEAQAIEFLKQICNGFIALVKEGIVHRDMKPANLLMSKGVIKIGDFGFAKQNITKRIKNQTTVGTPLYMPLQILKSQLYTSKCDIWAVGFIFYQIIHGKGPWTANTEFQLVKNIETKPLIIDKQLSIHTQNFLTYSLQKKQQDRMSWDEVFIHPIFEGFFEHYSQLNKQFQNKFKMVMTELRFKINSNNINLTKLIEALKFKNYKQMSYDEFSQFIRHIHAEITKQEIKYFFQQIDDNGDGKIQIDQLYTQMRKNHISIVKTPSVESQPNFNSQKKISRSNTSLENSGTQSHLAAEVARKAKKCFVKLNNLINTKKMSLFQTFFAYSAEKKGQLTFEDFKKMLRRLDETLAQDELEAIFQFIDVDHSKTIEFEELNSYYCKVNGIPESLDLPPEYVRYLKEKAKKN